MILFSIVVPYCNEEDKLPALLKSIDELEFDKEKTEVIFVSNNSSDKSDAIVEASGHRIEYAKRLRSSYYARNIGISSASGEFVVFVDADCILDKSILNAFSNAIELNKGGGHKVYAGSIQPAVKKGSLVETYSAARGVLNQKSAATGWSYKPFAQTANAMFLRRDLISVHGFNENMTSGGDAELCWRLNSRYGHNVVLCEEAIVYHQHRDTVEGFINQFMKYGRGRVQQALVSDIFAKKKKPDDFVHLKEKSEDLIDELIKSGCPEVTLYKVLDLFMGVYFNLGVLDELMQSVNGCIKGENYEFVSFLQKSLKIIPEKE